MYIPSETNVDVENTRYIVSFWILKIFWRKYASNPSSVDLFLEDSYSGEDQVGKTAIKTVYLKDVIL